MAGRPDPARVGIRRPHAVYDSDQAFHEFPRDRVYFMSGIAYLTLALQCPQKRRIAES
jgi:hypothetical protein